MEKQKVSPKILAFFIISIILLVIAIPVFTYAWFTDSKSYSNTLSFGEISLDVKSGVDETAKTVTMNVTRTNGSYTTGGKIYPGDTVNISVGLSVKSTSGPAYYLIYLTDSKGYFQEGSYFSDGTNVYFNNGIKTINQATSAEVTNKYVGAISSSSVTHTVNMKAVIDTALDNSTQNTSTDITLKIYAIQQYNLTESDARQELNKVKFTQEYTEKEYIKGSGSQCINSNYVPNQQTTVEYVVQNTTTGGAGFETGARIAYQNNTFVSMLYGSPTLKARFLYANNEMEDVTVTDAKYTIKFTGEGKFYIDNELKVTKTGSFVLSLPIYLFKFNNNGSATGGGVGNLYSYKIWNGNNLVRDLVPCVRKTDSKPGLFDMVNGKFYTNSGTGEFTCA